MKKIDKVELKNATVLNEKEMKNVVGGSGGFDPGYCDIHCMDGKIIEADTCRGAAYKCGNAGIGHCSGTIERCFSDFSGTWGSFPDYEDYYKS